MSENINKPPVHKVKYGVIEASLWENESKEGTYLTMSLQRNYKDKEDNWKSTNKSFRINDIPVIELALRDCFEFAKKPKQKEE